MKNSGKFNKVTSWILIILSIISIVSSIILSNEVKISDGWMNICESTHTPILLVILIILAVYLIRKVLLARKKKKEKDPKLYCQCVDCPSLRIEPYQSVFIVDGKYYHTTNICGVRALTGRDDENLSSDQKEKRAHHISIGYQEALNLAKEDIASGEHKLKFRKP